VPLNVQVLEALDSKPTPLPDLRRAVGHPPVTTMRSYVRNLTSLDVIERHREDDFPGSVSYTITKSGQHLLTVAKVLRQWLEDAPDGHMDLEDRAAKSVIRALVDGWDVGIVRALAARSLALTELDRLIVNSSYPALERRLTAMRHVGLLESDPHRNGRVARCQVTPWLRHAVAPLTAAVGWERQCIPEKSSAPSRLDAEAAFLLAVPLLDLPSDMKGACRLAVEFRRGPDLEFAGVMVTVQEGRISSCVTRIEGEPDAWAVGSTLDWFRWLRNGDASCIEIGGDASLAAVFEKGLTKALLS
jgi:DNA-binding HxlR family transcriptional regulator